MSKTRILGIDPGSRKTGWGVIDTQHNYHKYCACGVIQAGSGDFPRRLKTIFEELQTVIETYQPHEVAIEQVFMSRNADSALKLGQARGAAICAVVQHERSIHEYAARAIKQAVVGKGGADKNQVQHMVKILLNLTDSIQEDAADALATALCHAHTAQSQARLSSKGRFGL